MGSRRRRMMAGESAHFPPFFLTRKAVLWAALLLLFVLSLGVRLYDLGDAPLDFHPTRQLHSALMARGMYYQSLEEAPQWQREIAVRQWKAEGQIEPPFLEWLAAQTYRLMGREALWVAQLYSILFWLAGGVALFLLARAFSSAEGAFAAAGFYLLLPYGIVASRTFQPDPLMTALTVFSLWAILRWQRRQSWGWVIAAGLLGGAAILVKAVAVFFVAGAWIGLLLAGNGLRSALRNRQLWLAAALTILPEVVYLLYGIFGSGVLQSQFDQRFFPGLWISAAFYLRWIGKIGAVVGLGWFLAALLGIFLVARPAPRGLLLGAWVGYALYGLALPHHIGTHDYYSLPLIPLVGLGLAPLVALVLGHLRGPRPVLQALAAGVFLAAALMGAYTARTQLKRTDYRPEAIFWEDLGRVLGPGASVVALAPDYGYALAYWGWITPGSWYTQAELSYREGIGQGQDFAGLFAEKTAGRDFFVVTLMDELEQQPELENWLEAHYPLYDEGRGYRIYDLRMK